MTAPRTASTEPGRAEDSRVACARELLAESRAATVAPSPTESARWWGRFETALEDVLAYIDERAAREGVLRAALDAANRKPFDDLADTVAEIKAERGES